MNHKNILFYLEIISKQIIFVNIRELQQTKKEILKELKITRTTVKKLIGQREKLCKSTKKLRFIIASTKKEMLKMKTDFVEQKITMKSKINYLKKQLKYLKYATGFIQIYDDDYHVDPKTGVIDMTEPKTPPQPVRSKQSKKGEKSKLIQKKLKI